MGCQKGLDELVREACLSAVVFSVASGKFGSDRGAYAARSQAMVKEVVASGGKRGIGFVRKDCPRGLVPASSWKSGSEPNGTWSTLALALG